MYLETELFITIAGGLAGFIDAIAGGGGLINLPALMVKLGPGTLALGTNKVPGTLGAFVALLIYVRNQKLNWPAVIAFSIWASLAAFVGTQFAEYVPAWSFRWLLFFTCPFIFWIISKKDLWIAVSENSFTINYKSTYQCLIEWRIILAGLISGLYDGLWGPGGGTLMLLALLFVIRLPLIPAIAASKFANTCSGLISIAGFSMGNHIDWRLSAWSSLGLCIGAFIGAHFTTRFSVRIVRPSLALISSLLLIKLFYP